MVLGVYLIYHQEVVPQPLCIISSRRLGVLVALALCASASGCSVLFATSSQCNNDADCTSRGADFVGATCRAGYCQRGPVLDSGHDGTPLDATPEDARANPRWCEGLTSRVPQIGSTPLTIEASGEDLLSSAPTSDGRVRLCAYTDLACSAPRMSLVGGTPYVEDAGAGSDGGDAGSSTDKGWYSLPASGPITAPVEDAFNGFLEFRSDTYAPMVQMMAPIFDTPTTFSLTAARPAEAQQITAFASGRSDSYDDAHRGLVFAIVRDCNRQFVTNAHLTITSRDPSVKLPDPNAYSFYFKGALPSITETQTDVSGRGGVVNLLPGIYILTATVGDPPVLHGAAPIYVRAGTFTLVNILPTK